MITDGTNLDGIALDGVAIVGLAGRFPGAASVDAFWANLLAATDVTEFPSDDDLRARGVPQDVLDRPDYVKAALPLADADRFDAAFFDVSPAEAQILDPQQRVFLECCWHALEDAGYPPSDSPQATGVFGSTSVNSYQMHNLCTHPLLRNSRFGLDMSGLRVLFGNAPDFLTTRVSYKLNLAGPAVTVQTACSSSLIAVHQACQSLWNEECDLALAGGVSIRVPQGVGYFHEEGSIVSPDGRCRAFDAAAAGTIFGSGAGVVVLKRLADALADRDHIYAVVRGTAVNNDASTKAGFTAPSVGAQAQVIAEALEMAGFRAETVGYVETHGTGTHLGDPIEIAALSRAFRRHTDRSGYCAIGSVKTNVGHLDVAAGVTGLIKTALAVHHGVIPASLHYTSPNPAIDFAGTPFHVSARTARWPSDRPRRAGVTSLGVGGTNVHVVLEAAPGNGAGNRTVDPSGPARRAHPVHLLTLSAKTPAALRRATASLAGFLDQHREADLASVAFTLHRGRAQFAHRTAVLARDIDEAHRLLTDPTAERAWTGAAPPTGPAVVFGFPGQGAQYVTMGGDAYTHEPAFRAAFDRCALFLTPLLGCDLRDVVYPGLVDEAATLRLRQTRLAQPALFAIGYALAQLWRSWGVRPATLIGHSIGEYLAACLSGVFSLESALTLVAERGRLMQAAPPGAMLAVTVPETDLPEVLAAHPAVSVAAWNEPDAVVVAGPFDAIEVLERSLAGRGLASQRLQTSHAFHSAMMDPIVDAFRESVARVPLQRPELPFVSNVTGLWITAQDATSPDYWARHLRQPVRFAAGLRTALDTPRSVLLEVGPGRTLTAMARRRFRGTARILTSLPHPRSGERDLDVLHSTLARLWLDGYPVDWSGYHAGEPIGRVPLPGYPFERTRYWYDPGRPVGGAAPAAGGDPAGGDPAGGAAGNQPADGYVRPELGTAYVAPRTTLQARVAELIRSVLGIESVGIHDSFFDLGLDSVMAVQVAARGSTARLPLTPKQVFEHATVASLADALAASCAQPACEDGAAGPVPLTPYQAWVLAHDPELARRWARVVMLSARTALDPARVRTALGVLVRRHDVFRIRYARTGGAWRQDIVEGEPPDPLAVVAPTADPPRDLPAAVENAIAWCADDLSLDEGRLCRVALLRGTDPRRDHLLLVLHHLIADDASLAVLLGEFEAAYRQTDDDVPIVLPRTTSFAAWASSAVSRSAGTTESSASPHVPAAPGGAPGVAGAAGFLRRTAAVPSGGLVDRLQQAARHVRVEVDDVLLAAVLSAVDERAEATAWIVRVPHSLRDRRPTDADLSRADLSCSVGAFAALRTLRVQRPVGDDAQALLLRVKQARLGAGPDGAAPGASAPEAILFRCSHLAALPAGSMFAATPDSADIPQVTAALGDPLEVCLTVDGAAVRGTWFFAASRYTSAEADLIVDAFGSRLVRLVDDCTEHGRALYAPGDFPDADLDQSDLDGLLKEFGVS